jgi:hypothetical protein
MKILGRPDGNFIPVGNKADHIVFNPVHIYCVYFEIAKKAKNFTNTIIIDERDTINILKIEILNN